MQRRPYAFLTDLSMLHRFLEFCRCQNCVPPITDKDSFAQAVKQVVAIDEGLAEECKAWWGATLGYRRLFVRRMLLVQALASSQGEIAWDEIPLSLLREVCPDQDCALSAFPDKCSVGAASQFVFDRSDCGILVPVMSCLFKEVADGLKTTMSHASEVLSSQAFRERAAARHRERSYAAHPYNLIKGQGVLESVGTLAPAQGQRTSSPGQSREGRTLSGDVE